MSARMLLVEDDLDVAEMVCLALQDEGWTVDHVANGSVGLQSAVSDLYDLVILDVRLPGMNGFDLCRQLRHTSSVPLLFLTARGEEMDKVVGLESGADDYLTKPFGVYELKARLRALLRRGHRQPAAEKRIRVHDLLILPERRSVFRGEERIPLTNSEFTLLLTMARRPGIVFTREMLLEMLWETDMNTGSPLTLKGISQVDLTGLVQGALPDWGAQTEQAGQTLKVALPDEPVLVLAHAEVLLVALTNLVDNACKFTPPGGLVSVSLSATAGEAVIEVADTGPGITPEELPHIFKRFYRGIDTQRLPGSGLGLAIVHEATTRMGGRVTATSEVGVGSRFGMHLPTIDTGGERSVAK